MKKSRLILRNLWHYRKPWLAVFAGATISIAVLTGALAVGDSVRYSLRKLTDARLGKTRFVLQSRDYLFSDSLADRLFSHLNDTNTKIISGSFSRGKDDPTPAPPLKGEGTGGVKKISEPIVPLLLSEGIAVNSENGKRINRAEVIGMDPRFSASWDLPETPLREDEAVISRNAADKLELLPGDEFLLRIRERSNISRNAPFADDKEYPVSLRLKVKAVAGDDNMGRFSLKSNQSAPFNIFISLRQLNAALGLSGKANVLLVPEVNGITGETANSDSIIGKAWQPTDIGLKTRKLPVSGLYEITSERIFMDDSVAEAVRSSVPGCSGILTYLANSLGSEDRSAPYSFVCAADGSFLGMHLGESEIIINEWLAADLHVRPGDTLTMSYYVIGPRMSLREKSKKFIIRSVIPMKDPLCDRELMPDFPGMSEAGNCRDWETATPIDLDRIRDKDEQYWKDYRGTPKAFISLETGRKLWKNSFGSHTAFRFKADADQAGDYERTIMQKLKPSEQGLQFIPVYAEGRSAAAGSTDFGSLFLGLSFFIIIAGLLLMGIIFSVQAYSRLTETAVLSSMGFRKRQVMGIILSEALWIIILAGIAGSLFGLGYDRLMLLGLNTLWQDTVRTSSLQMHVSFTTLAMGAVAGMIMALATLVLILYRKMKRPVMAVLHSATSTGTEVHGKTAGKNFPSFSNLVLKNSRLKLKRTVGAVVLLAIGTFTVIITGANRRIFPDAPSDRGSGTGGFLSWAECTIPVNYDLNTPAGKKQFALEDDTLFHDVSFLQLKTLDGEDASCLNLNRVKQPVLLGIDGSYLDAVSAFTFQSLGPSFPKSLNPSVPGSHPWKVLEHPLPEGVIPGIADQTVIKWGLGMKVGDTLIYMDESGKPLKIILVAGLDNSIFQGNILVSDSLFLKYYPSSGGSRIILVDGPFHKRQAVDDELENIFRDYGMVVTPASQRLDEFNSVQNTYLSVFMLLGGLGVVIGTFGLGFLLMRNLQERQPELATYIALGFRKRFIIRLLLAEHLLILVSGTILGIVTGLAAIVPSLLSSSSDIPFAFLGIMIGVIFLTGFLWIIIPVRSAFRGNTAEVLRKEF